MHASATSVYAKQKKKVRSRQGLSGRGHGPLPQKRPRQRTLSLPVFCPLDNIRPAEEGHLADLTFIRKKEDRRAGLVGRLPYIARHLAWPEGEEHMAKLAVNALIGLGPVQGRLLLHAHLQSRVGRPGLPVPAGLLRRPGPVPLRPRLRHGALLQPLHAARPRFRHGFGVRGDGEDPPGPARGAAPLPGGAEDRLPGLSEPSAKVRAHRGGADQAAPPGQHAQVSLRGGEAIGGRVPGAAAGDGAADGAGALAPRGGSRGALPQRPQPLVVRHAGHGEDAPGEGRSCRSSRSSAKGSP